MPTVDAVGTAVPSTRIPQDKLRELARGLFVESDPLLARVLAVFDNARIDERAFAMPLDWYYEEHGFKDRSAAYVSVGLELAERASREAVARAGLQPAEIDGVVFVSTTGIATPSLDARLANVLGLSPSVVRLPVWGLGCSGGVGGLNRASDLARAYPGKRFLVVALELCSLAFDLRRLDKKTLVASSLFADGCAAVVVSGDGAGGTGPRHAASTSHLFPRTERVMGWDVEDHTLDVVFSTEIPDLVASSSGDVARPFLARHGVERPDHYVFHPGGAKVLEAYERSFGLPPEALARSRETLRMHGNMSSATVLFTLRDTLAAGAPAPGETALLASVGPGFAMDLALLRG